MAILDLFKKINPQNWGKRNNLSTHCNNRASVPSAKSGRNKSKGRRHPAQVQAGQSKFRKSYY